MGLLADDVDDSVGGKNVFSGDFDIVDEDGAVFDADLELFAIQCEGCLSIFDVGGVRYVSIFLNRWNKSDRGLEGEEPRLFT